VHLRDRVNVPGEEKPPKGAVFSDALRDVGGSDGGEVCVATVDRRDRVHPSSRRGDAELATPELSSGIAPAKGVLPSSKVTVPVGVPFDDSCLLTIAASEQTLMRG